MQQCIQCELSFQRFASPNILCAAEMGMRGESRHQGCRLPIHLVKLQLTSSLRFKALNKDSRSSNSAYPNPFNLSGLLGSRGKRTALICNWEGKRIPVTAFPQWCSGSSQQPYCMPWTGNKKKKPPRAFLEIRVLYFRTFEDLREITVCPLWDTNRSTIHKTAEFWHTVHCPNGIQEKLTAKCKIKYSTTNLG